MMTEIHSPSCLCLLLLFLSKKFTTKLLVISHEHHKCSKSNLTEVIHNYYLTAFTACCCTCSSPLWLLNLLNHSLHSVCTHGLMTYYFLTHYSNKKKGKTPVPWLKSKYIKSMANMGQTESRSMQVKVLGLIFTAGGLEMPKDIVKHA